RWSRRLSSPSRDRRATTGVKTMPTLVMLPPHDEIVPEWARRLATDVPDLDVVEPNDESETLAVLASADAAYGRLTPERLRVANRLRWLQAPAAAPPDGFYFPELIEHPVRVTNLRGIYNDHVGIHAMAFVLALARGFARYMPLQ